MNAKLRSPETAAAVAGLEGRLTSRRRDQKIKSGAFRGMHVVVYCGFVADDVAKVRVRVVEVPELPGDSRIPYWETAQSNLRRHAALPMVGVEVELALEPGPTLVQDVGPLLLGGVRGLFLRVMLWRSKNRQTAATLTDTPRAASASRISSKVRSEFVSISVRMKL